MELSAELTVGGALALVPLLGASEGGLDEVVGVAVGGRGDGVYELVDAGDGPAGQGGDVIVGADEAGHGEHLAVRRHFLPQTTLRGVVEKHTNEEPFDVPDRILAAARESGDVPVGFLGDADTTGGNSGSPAVNGRGELVGVNFDRVWENVANDFAYNPAVARNVNADIRYTLWLLERVEKAPELLKELGVKE